MKRSDMRSRPDERPINRLDRLPALDPPPALWSSIRSELDQRALDRRHKNRGWLAAGLAAVLLLSVSIGLLDDRKSKGAPGPGSAASLPPEDPQLVQARRLSAALEAGLRRSQHSSVSSGSVESLVWLENELGWLDMRLANQPDSLALWQRRIELLGEMNRLYSRNDWQTQMQLTSF